MVRGRGNQPYTGDGIDIMMGRRGNQAHAGRGMSRLCNPRIYLAAGKLTALSGLCPLSHLDLNLLGTDQIAGGHTEPAGSHLLDGRTAVIVLRPRLQPV